MLVKNVGGVHDTESRRCMYGADSNPGLIAYRGGGVDPAALGADTQAGADLFYEPGASDCSAKPGLGGRLLTETVEQTFFDQVEKPSQPEGGIHHHRVGRRDADGD